MEKTVLNSELILTCPEGFRELTKEELGQYRYYKETPGWCVKDEDRHIMLSVSWVKSFGPIAAVTNSEGVAKSMEKKVRKLMAQSGYRLDGFIRRELGGKTADGFRYEYTAQETEMTGETFSVKNGRMFYYIYYYARTDLREESIRILEEIFDTAEWKIQD